MDRGGGGGVGKGSGSFVNDISLSRPPLTEDFEDCVPMGGGEGEGGENWGFCGNKHLIFELLGILLHYVQYKFKVKVCGGD